MKHILIIFSILIFSLTVISWSSSDSGSSTTSTITDKTTTIEENTTTTSSSSFSSKGKFIAVGASGNIVKSKDNGSSFENVTSPTGNRLLGVVFGNNNFGQWLLQ